MSLALFAPMFEWIQELRVKTRQASQVLGIYLIGLTLVGVDKPQLPGIGHQDLVAAPLEHSANPGRVGASLYCDAHGLLGSETPPKGLRGGAQPAFLYNLATLLIDEAQG
jgi:hypothetical protein